MPIRPARLMAALLLLASTARPQAPQLALPKPQTGGGRPLMQALELRRTSREFSARPLDPQMLSNLLWAAFGVNRAQTARGGPGRTAPSAMNRQEIQLYVLLESGAYLYDALAHSLKPVAPTDLRPLAGPPAAAHAAVTLVYVAGANESWAAVDSGFIGQNVYLFASAFGLNAWFRASGVAELAVPLKLDAGRKALFTQTVGYPPQ